MNAEPSLNGSRRWSRNRWLIFIALIFAAHVALIFIFSPRQPPSPRPVANVPALEVSSGGNELFSLNDPSLFSLPHIEGFAGPWMQPPHVEFHRLEWTESPRWLQFSAGQLGNIFDQFMRTNQFISFELELKPKPELLAPQNVPLQPFAKNSLLQIRGGIARRPLVNKLILPSWPNGEELKPSAVQILVDAAGYVISTALISSSQSDEADQAALLLSRAARFAPLPEGIGVTNNPASRLMFGQLIFDWHTLPLTPVTNAGK